MDKNTIEVMRNFSTINQSIMIYAGNSLATMATTKNIFASAVVATEFPRDFAIYNLPEFLSVLSLFAEPKIEYGENDITIKEGKMKVRYQYSSPAVVISPPKGKSILVRDVLARLGEFGFGEIEEVRTATEDIQFSLPKNLRSDLKAAGEQPDRPHRARAQRA